MQSVFEAGFSTSDLTAASKDIQLLSTTEFGDKVIEALDALL
jgi:isocitrate dehydrogenase